MKAIDESHHVMINLIVLCMPEISEQYVTRDSPSILPRHSALSHFWSVIGAASFFFSCWQRWVNLSIRNDTWKSDVSRTYVASVDVKEKAADGDISLVQRDEYALQEDLRRSRDIIRVHSCNLPARPVNPCFKQRISYAKVISSRLRKNTYMNDERCSICNRVKYLA